MVAVVDANILIQCIINIKGRTAALIFENSSYVDFAVPAFILSEIVESKHKIFYGSLRQRQIAFDNNLELLLANLLIVKDDEIPDVIFEKAYDIVRGIDPDDTIYVALAIALDGLLWTDDLKLLRALRRKGFNSIVNTKDFKETLKGLK